MKRLLCKLFGYSFYVLFFELRHHVMDRYGVQNNVRVVAMMNHGNGIGDNGLLENKNYFCMV